MGSFINSTTIEGTGSSRTSAPVDMTGANLIVVIFICNFSAGINLSDSEGNTWTSSGSSLTDPSLSTKGGFRYCINPTTDVAQTFTLDNGNGNQCGIVLGFDFPCVFDSVNLCNSATFDDEITAPSITPSSAPALILAALGKAGQAGSVISVDSGFTAGPDLLLIDNQQWGLSCAYKFQSVAAAETPKFTTSLDTAHYLTSEQIAFRETGSDFTIGADQGSYTLTGEPALFGRGFTAARGLYMLTGEPASFGGAGGLVAGTGYYALTGGAAGFHLNEDYDLLADTGFYNVTGYDATFCKRRSWANQDCTDSPWVPVRKSNPES